MSEHFIPLKCLNCGGSLDVYDDMDRFACGFCGTAMIAQRRGGTISLTSVTEAIHKVQVGTDRTAAELALVRLNEHLGKLTEEETLVANSTGSSYYLGAFFLIFFGLMVFIIGTMGTTDSPGAVLFGLMLMSVGGGVGRTGWERDQRSPLRLAELSLQISEVRVQIQQQLKIVA